MLRAKNIPSEAVLGILKPSELVTHGTQYTQNALKNKILLDVWNKLEQGEGIIGRDDFLDLSNAFNGMEFFFLIRALKVSERSAELDGANDKEFEERLTSIFISINTIERSKNKNWIDLKYDLKSLHRYINDYLPREIGKNYAMLHDEELVHVFPHAGNITGAGEICDLDSVKGPAINCGDKKNSKNDNRKDFQYMLSEAGKSAHSISRRNPLGNIFYRPFYG